MEKYPDHHEDEGGARHEYPLSPLGYGLAGSAAGVVIIALIGFASYGIGSAVDAIASFIA